MNEEKQEPTIRELMERIVRTMEQQSKEPEKKQKKFKLKFPKLTKKQEKENYVCAIFLKTNGNIDAQKVKISDEIIKDKEGYPHAVTVDYIWRYRGQPTVIIPEWSFEPLRTTRLLQEMKEKNIRSPYDIKIVERYLERGQIEQKKKVGGMTIIWIIIGVIAMAIIAKALKLF